MLEWMYLIQKVKKNRNKKKVKSQPQIEDLKFITKRTFVIHFKKFTATHSAMLG